MGIGWSVHRNGGWSGQLDRLRRWHNRICSLHQEKGLQVGFEDLDLVFTFFQNCYLLREWVAISRDVPTEELDDFMKKNIEMRVCRDIANGTKHFHLTRPSLDAEFSIGREYMPDNDGNPGHNWFVIAGEKYDLFDLANQCMNLWEQFLADREASSEHLYPGFSVFAQEILRSEIDSYQKELSQLQILTDENEREQLRARLEERRVRLLDDLYRVLEGLFSFDSEERDELLRELDKEMPK